MAAGTFVIPYVAKTKLIDGTHDLDTHVFKMALCTQAQTLGAATTIGYSGLTGQVANGNGYTTGGKTVAITLSRSGGTVTVNCASQQWTASTFSAKWAVIYNDTATNKDLLCYVDLETTVPAGLSPSNGNLDVNTSAGLFTLA